VIFRWLRPQLGAKIHRHCPGGADVKPLAHASMRNCLPMPSSFGAPLASMIALAVLAVGGIAAPAQAEQLAFTCPASTLLLALDATDFSIAVETDAPATATLKGAFGEITLPAEVQRQEAMIGVHAQGEAKMAMPDKAAVDACLAARKVKDPSQFENGRNAYLELGCKRDAAMSEPVPVNLTVDLTVIERPDATLALSRTHLGEDGDAAQIHGVDIVGSCTLAAE
jgi:hypothetical protein